MTSDPYSGLRGRIALVTGAGLGIGAAVARGLGAAGATVVCSARTQSQIDEVAQAINDAGGRAIAVAADVTAPDQVAALADRIDEAFGGLDIAFLNAGGNLHREAIAESDAEAWRYTIELNLHSVFYGIQAVTPLMRKRGGGRIIFTGSAMGHYPAVNNSAYCAAKAGARMVAFTAAQELMADNITVNEFIPGPVRTKQALHGVTPDDTSSPFNNPTEWVKDPDDVVDMVLMMAAYPGKGPTSQIFSLARR